MTKKLLAILVLAGLLLRFPGVFWGFGWFQPGTRYLLHHDEDNIIAKAYEAFDGVNIRVGYPPGFAVQVMWASKAMDFVNDYFGVFRNTDMRDLVNLISLGRVLSLLYGTATILLTYLIAKNVFKDEVTVILSAAFTAFAGLHVIESHFSTTDASATFWMYASLLFMLKYLDSQKTRDLLIASIFTGLVAGTKNIWFTIVPLVYLVFTGKRKLLNIVVVAASVLLGLALITNFLFYPEGSGILKGGLTKNIVYWKTYFNPAGETEKVSWTPLNYLRYPIILAVGLSVPVFMLSLHGLVQSLSRKDKKMLLMVVCMLPYYLTVSMIHTHIPRFMLPLIPLLSLNAGAALAGLKKHKKLIIFLVVAYQLASTASMEYYYFHDTRKAAGEWAIENLPHNARIGVDNFEALPPGFIAESFVEGGYGRINKTIVDSADYLILNEPFYRRCLKNIYATTWKNPEPDETYRGAYSCGFVQSLLTGNEDFTLIQTFESRPLTPELIIFKKIWGSYTTWSGDTLVYAKI